MTTRPAPGRKAGKPKRKPEVREHVEFRSDLLGGGLLVTCCRVCGSVKPLAGWPSECKGPVSIGLRKHGPKPKRRGVAMPRAFCHDCKGEVMERLERVPLSAWSNARGKETAFEAARSDQRAAVEAACAPLRERVMELERECDLRQKAMMAATEALAVDDQRIATLEAELAEAGKGEG